MADSKTPLSRHFRNVRYSWVVNGDADYGLEVEGSAVHHKRSVEMVASDKLSYTMATATRSVIFLRILNWLGGWGEWGDLRVGLEDCKLFRDKLG